MNAAVRRVWITGGGTREPIDAVRFVGNHSTGRLACAIAGEALVRGLPTTCFLGQGALEPPAHDLLRVQRYTRSEDLLRLLLEETAEEPDCIVHAAAVSDYAPEPLQGKVASGAPEWTLRLLPLPKIAPRIRQRFPRACLVTFKLETGISAAELKERARASARNAGATWVFANLLEDALGKHSGFLLNVNDSREIPLASRSEIAKAILDAALP